MLTKYICVCKKYTVNKSYAVMTRGGGGQPIKGKGVDGPIRTHSYCAHSSVTSAKLLKKAIVRKP